MYSSLITYIKQFPKTEKVSVKVGGYTEHAKVKSHLLNTLNKPELYSIAISMAVPQDKKTKEDFVDWILDNHCNPMALPAPMIHPAPMALPAPMAFQSLNTPKAIQAPHAHPVAKVTKAELDELRSLVAAFTARLDALTL